MKNKKSNISYKKIFIKRLITFLLIQIIFLFFLILIQHDYAGVNSDNTTQIHCKIDNIYFFNTIGRRHDPYCVDIGEETYILHWNINQPGKMKDVKDYILSEKKVTITIKNRKNILSYWKFNTFEIVDIRTDNTVYFDMHYVDEWEDMQRGYGMVGFFMLWIPYTLLAGYILIFYRGEKF